MKRFNLLAVYNYMVYSKQLNLDFTNALWYLHTNNMTQFKTWYL